MKRLVVTPDGVINGDTGEIHGELTHSLLLSVGGGVIAGRNLYPAIARFISVNRTNGWAAKIHMQEQRTSDAKRPRGIIYVSHVTHKLRKQVNGKRKQTSTKYLILNLELFTETTDTDEATRELVKLAEQRGIKPRYSPGSFGSALLRASPDWKYRRNPAPWFISEAARAHLPGNYYATRHGYKSVDRAYYLDQRSSHHTVAAEIDMPDPEYLRARGRFRSVEAERTPNTYRQIEALDGHIGVIIARITCGHIAPSIRHLYPAWAREFGTHTRWIWTPELRLLNWLVRIEHIAASLTSIRADPALREYAKWSLEYLSHSPNSVVKPTLLAAYGMLAVKNSEKLTSYSVHDRKPPGRAEVITLPLLDKVYRSQINRQRVPSVQNVVARGVIEAEVKVRSIELARQLESEKSPVVHIYADGLIVETDQLPFLPANWRVAGSLTDVSSPAPHSILSRELVRLPGIPNGRRMAYIRKDEPGEALPGERSSLHLREREPAVSAKSLLY